MVVHTHAGRPVRATGVLEAFLVARSLPLIRERPARPSVADRGGAVVLVPPRARPDRARLGPGLRCQQREIKGESVQLAVEGLIVDLAWLDPLDVARRMAFTPRSRNSDSVQIWLEEMNPCCWNTIPPTPKSPSSYSLLR